MSDDDVQKSGVLKHKDIIEKIREGVAKRLKDLREDIEPDFDEELDDKIDDIFENDPKFFDGLDKEDKKELVVSQLVKELT